MFSDFSLIIENCSFMACNAFYYNTNSCTIYRMCEMCGELLYFLVVIAVYCIIQLKQFCNLDVLVSVILKETDRTFNGFTLPWDENLFAHHNCA